MALNEQRPILYSFRRCPYAIRARMALRVSGVSCELREVVLRDKPREMLACSPKGTVPVLQLPDGRVIDESLDIIIGALQRNDPEHWLPRTASGQTRAMELIATNDGDFKHHLDRYKYANRYPGVESVTHRIEAEKFLARLEEELVVGSFLAGARPGLADFAIGPFIRQFANADRAWFDETSYPHLHTWLDWFLGSDPFMAVMKKYPQWFPDQVPILFP